MSSAVSDREDGQRRRAARNSPDKPMDANTSSSQNVSSHSTAAQGNCFSSAPGFSIFTVFTTTNVLLLLPLSVFVLSFGFRRWRKQRCDAAMNPVDVFTYHMVAMEMFGMGGSITCCCGAFTAWEDLMTVGCNVFAIISCVKMFFHVLTCVERYVAVVHPVTYLSLSKTGGVTVRNVSIACVWLACAALIALRLCTGESFNMILFFCNLSLSLIVSSFCSLSVLRVLNRAGPGDEGGAKGKTDKSKQKAFTTITAIMAVLLLRFGGNLVCMALASSAALDPRTKCVAQVSGVWFCLPSSYVLPLLFLHRAETLLCFKYNKK